MTHMPRQLVEELKALMEDIDPSQYLDRAEVLKWLGDNADGFDLYGWVTTREYDMLAEEYDEAEMRWDREREDLEEEIEELEELNRKLNEQIDKLTEEAA